MIIKKQCEQCLNYEYQLRINYNNYFLQFKIYISINFQFIQYEIIILSNKFIDKSTRY